MTEVKRAAVKRVGRGRVKERMNRMHDLQRLRLLWAAYAKNQPDAKRQNGMAQALYRYVEATRLREAGSDAGIDPLRPIDRIKKI